jgi:hypothetical protein
LLDWGVPILYGGLLLAAAGIVSLMKPLRFLAIRSRRAGFAAALSGVVLAAAGVLLPAPLKTSPVERTRLDNILPSFQFDEFHEVHVRAPAARVFRAIRLVTAREIRFFRLLTWIRSPRLGARRESIVAPPPDAPLLDVALRTGFVFLGEEPDREIVFGTMLCRRLPGLARITPAEFAAFSEPGYCKVAMNFRVAGEEGGFVRLTTETRVLALGSDSRRQFTAYWRMIYPGSALIRRMWLAAIRRRAMDPLSGCREAIEPLARPVDEALARFENGGAADEVLGRALLVREKLEQAAIDPVCEVSRREVLIYLNHVILGFQRYLARGLPDRDSRAELESILQRARAHERRGIAPKD